MELVDDGDLALSVAVGDPDAFTALANRHRDRVYAICRRITCNHEDAEEALQNTLIIAWRRLGDFDGRSAVATWLYRIATNVAIDEVRRRARAPRPVDVVPDDLPHEGVDRAIVAKIDVDRALAQLPPHYRAVTILRELCDLTYREIAEARGVPVDTVKSQLSRGRQALVALLRDPVPAAP